MNRKQQFVLVAGSLVAAAAVLWVVPERSHAKPPSGTDLLATSRVSDVVPVAHREEANQIVLDGEWELAEANGEIHSDKPDWAGLAWKRVKMPNTLQHALFEANAAPNPWYSDNWKKLQWVAEHDWYLRRRFRIPEEWSGHHVRLTFDGMDYLGVIWLDGKLLGVHEGMFGGPTFDVTSAAAPVEHELVVRLVHERQPNAIIAGISTMKSTVMKSCAVDGCSSIWGNKFRSIGLWRSVRLVSSGVAYMEAPYVRTDSLTGSAARLWAQVMVVNTGGARLACTVSAKIIDTASGRMVWQNAAQQTCPPGTSFWEHRIELKQPRVWWPNGLGSQPLYRLELSLLNNGSQLDAISSRFGVRTLEMRRNPYLPGKSRSNPGQPDWLSDLSLLHAKPKPFRWGRADFQPADNLVDDEGQYNSDESHRYLFAVNNRPFYAKGVCWLTSDDLLTLTPEREEWMIRAAKASGINLFRLNGGNDIFETEQFYNLCDENGILVWQELPFTWTAATEIPLIVWREQLKRSILRLRQHASLAVYVGGNEFMPYQEFLAPYLGIARELVAAYDNRPFRMSSPGGSDYHAYGTPAMGFDALWGGDPNWYVKLYDEAANFISEWSYWSYANMSLLKRITPMQELASGPVGYDVKKFIEMHPTLRDHSDLGEVDALLPLVHRKASWYGDLAQADLGQLVEYSQMAQADVYGYVFEHWRSQFPYKGGEALWTYNSHAPASYWNVIDWFGQPQMAYYSTKRADEPVHIMANLHSLTWAPGDTFVASVYGINDGLQEIKGARVLARILDGKMRPLLIRDWETVLPAIGMRSEARDVTLQIPAKMPPSYLFLDLTLTSANGKRLSRRAYWIRVVNLPKDPAARDKQLSAPDPLVKSGPWLKTEIEEAPTEIAAEILGCDRVGPEARLRITIKNTGPNPAYPVRLTIEPDWYSVIWTDNYFWLDPGESASLQATIRLDMTGLDPLLNPKIAKISDLALKVSAWNAKGRSFSLGRP
jgi:beta-mannosidase